MDFAEEKQRVDRDVILRMLLINFASIYTTSPRLSTKYESKTGSQPRKWGITTTSPDILSFAVGLAEERKVLT